MIPAQADELLDRLAADVLDEHDGVGGKAGLLDPRPQRRSDRPVGLERPGRAAEQRRVARLQAEPRGVRGDVRPVLVDDADDPEGHADPPDREPVRADPALDDLADGVGEGLRPREGPPPSASIRDGVEAQPVDDGRSDAGGLGSPDVVLRSRRGSRRGRPRAPRPRARAPRSSAALDALASSRAAALARRPSASRGVLSAMPNATGRAGPRIPAASPGGPVGRARRGRRGARARARGPPASSPCARRSTRSRRCRGQAGDPLREHRAVRADDLDGVVAARTRPRRRRRRRAAATPRAPRGARRAPSSTTTRPAAGSAKAIQSLRAPSRRSCGRKIVPTPGWPRDRVAERRRGGRRPRSRRARPTTPPSAPRRASRPCRRCRPGLPAPPATRSRSRSIAATSSTSVASAVRRGSASSSPARVGQQHEQVGAERGWRRAPPAGRCRRSGSRRRRRRRSRSRPARRRARAAVSSVARACRYWRRSPKSSGASRTWPASRPSAAKASS